VTLYVGAAQGRLRPDSVTLYVGTGHSWQQGTREGCEGYQILEGGLRLALRQVVKSVGGCIGKRVTGCRRKDESMYSSGPFIHVWGEERCSARRR
jgi:hypothetical protein